MENRTICFFIGNIGLSGGTERVTSVIANDLSSLGYKVHILSLHLSGSSFFDLSNDIFIDRLFYSTGRGIVRAPITIWKLRQYIKRNGIDIIISVESMLSIYSLPAVMGLNVRHICWEHFNYYIDLGKKMRVFARHLAAVFSNDIVVLTNKDKNAWLKETNCRANISVINNPITIEYRGSSTIKNKVVLAVGRLTNQKGFDLLLKAWAAVCSEKVGWKLKIVGNGEEEFVLKTLAKDLCIDDSIEFIPSVKNIEEYYAEAAFFVLSSRFEGFGLVILEAQSYYLPVVSYNCNFGPDEIIIDNKSGWLCRNGSVDDLAKKIFVGISTFENDSDSYNKMCMFSKLNSERFSIQKAREGWLNILDVGSI